MIGLTARQQQCLDFLRSYHAEKGIAPTLQEITDKFGWQSKSNAARVLELLEDRGHIRRSYKKARSIEFISPETMSAVLLSKEVFLLARAYAASQHITIDTAVSELLRSCLDPHS